MNLLERLRQQIGALNRPLKRAVDRKAIHTVITNRWDERDWADARKVPVIDKLIGDLGLGDDFKGGQRTPFERAPELTHDVFMAFYKAMPRLEDPANLVRDVYAVRKIVEEILGNPRFDELREVTKGDPVMSTIALDSAAEELRALVGRVPPPPPPPAPRAPKQDKPEPGEPGEPGQPGDQPGDQRGDGQGDQPGEGGEFDPEAEQDDQAERDWETDYDAKLTDLDLERAVIKALDAASDGIEELETIRKGIGLEDGEWQSMSAVDRLAMAERLRTPEMKLLADAIGRMKRFALGTRATRIINVPHEICDVETGDDIQRVLGSEFALLSTPETTYEFYRKYVDKQLLQFRMSGEEQVGKGPIVLAIDKSGSMQGQPFIWAMAVAEALRRFAAEEDRDYYAIFFGRNNDRHRFDFPKGKGPFEKVLAFLSCVASGGTAYDGVLTEALQKASTAFDGEARGKADILLITDGYASLTEQWIADFNAERQRVGVRLYSVYIGGAYDMAGREGPLGLLGKISDVTIPVRELKPQSVKQVFAQI